MEKQPNTTKSKSGDTFIPKPMLMVADGCEKQSADDCEGKRRSCRLTQDGVPIDHRE